MSDNESTRNGDNGVVNISDEVVATIAALAASDVEGVATLSVGKDIGEWLGRKNLTKGVKITMQERTVFLDISLIVHYGCPITTVAQQVQKKVKDTVESMTGMAVGEINISVCGVAFEKESKKPSREKKPA